MSQIPYQIDPATGVQLVDQELVKSCASVGFQYVDVVFNSTVNVDTTIAHTLNTTDIAVVPVEWRFAIAPSTTPILYRDVSGSARAWQKQYIVLRCNVASAACTLLLLSKRLS